MGAVVQRGHKRAGRAQHVEHDARGRAQIALGEHGQFRRSQDGFNFHFASREGREGGEEYLQPIQLLGIKLATKCLVAECSKFTFVGILFCAFPFFLQAFVDVIAFEIVMSLV